MSTRIVPKTHFSNNLDILRTIAVLSVLISHVVHLTGTRIGSLGRFGVILFFIHTSYVLTASLDRLQQSAETNARLVFGFWIRRIFRIYPLAMFFVIAIALFHIPPNPTATYTWMGVRHFFSNLFLVQNLTTAPDILGVLWSLPLEMQMYVFLPFIFLAVRNRSSYAAFALFAASLLAGSTIAHLNWRLNVFAYAPCFCAGIMAFRLQKGRDSGYKLPSWAWIAGILLAFAAFGPLDDLPLGLKMHRAWALSFCIALLFVHVKEVSGNIFQPIYHWIAEHSYGIYLVHTVLLWILVSPLQHFPVWVRCVIFAGSMIAAPWVLYRWIEHPFVLLGSHISRRWLHPHLQRTTLSPGSASARPLTQ